MEGLAACGLVENRLKLPTDFAEEAFSWTLTFVDPSALTGSDPGAAQLLVKLLIDSLRRADRACRSLGVARTRRRN